MTSGVNQFNAHNKMSPSSTQDDAVFSPGFFKFYKFPNTYLPSPTSSWLRAQIFKFHSLTSLFPFQDFLTSFPSRKGQICLPLEGGMDQPSFFYIQGNQNLPSNFCTPGTELGTFTFLIHFRQACGEASRITLFCRRSYPAKGINAALLS